jgi:hypothetical protein
MFRPSFTQGHRITTLSAVALGVAVSSALATEPIETPFPEAELFFELNNTDSDLGIHGNIDGPGWKYLNIFDPNERVLANVTARGSMRRQGLTQLSFESAEPSFDELTPEQFFARFPEGVYEIEAVTLEGGELESVVEITHVMPAPPEFISPALAPCTAPVTVGGPVTIAWKPVTTSHPDVGTPDEPVTIERYELAVERVDLGLKIFVTLPPNMTSFAVPAPLIASPGVVKFEVLAKADGGNRTAEESCFRVP